MRQAATQLVEIFVMMGCKLGDGSGDEGVYKGRPYTKETSW